MSQSEEKPSPVECESNNRSSANQENKLEAEAERNCPGLAVAAKKRGTSSPSVPALGVDTCTGLPKLPIEPVVDSEDDLEPETPSLTLTSWNFNPQSGSLTAVMSNILSSPKANRKSVTFDTQVKVKRDSSEEVNFKECPPLDKCQSDPLLRSNERDDDSGGMELVGSNSATLPSRRSRGRPANILRNGRSRSVYIRLQRSTPTLFRKGSESIDSHQVPPLVGLQQDRLALNSESKDTTDRGSTSERTSSHHDDQEAASPTDEHRPNLGQRRTSFLYHSDSEDLDEAGASVGKFSRGTSLTSSHVGDETYVTPFAQILATLHRMRSQYITLTGLPEDTMTPYSRPGWTSPSLSSDRKFSISPDKDKEKLAVDILEELDWCLKKLEAVSSTKSMGNMARDKFRRLLNRELSHLSEGSRKGAQVAEWVTNITNMDANVERALDTVHNLSTSSPHSSFEVSLTESCDHHNWANQKKLSSSSECDRIPIFGVESTNMNKRQMTEYASGVKLMNWDVDVFRFTKATGDNPLICSTYIIFQQRRLFTNLAIRPRTFVKFITAIQSLYHNNPYHNAIHATDVFLSSNYLLNGKALEGVFTDLEVMAILVAAAIHDVDHPGVNNKFLITVRHGLATLYNDISVLENHHLATAFKTMQNPGCNILESFESDKILAFRKMIIDMVLATDMGKHLEYLAEFKTLLETKKVSNNGILVLDKYSERMSVLQCLLHCADLGNPGKAVSLSVQWTNLIMEEFYRQGDKEKELSIPVQPSGDRRNTCIPSFQISFIDFIIFPLWEAWAELVFPDGQEILDNISAIKEYWTSRKVESSSPSEEDSPPQSSRAGSEEIFDKVPAKKEVSPQRDSEVPRDHDRNRRKTSPTKSPVRSPVMRFRQKNGGGRNSIDLNKSVRFGGSVNLSSNSSLYKLGMSEREEMSKQKKSSRATSLDDKNPSPVQLHESLPNPRLSRSADSGLSEAAKERRTSFKAMKQLPITKEALSYKDS